MTISRSAWPLHNTEMTPLRFFLASAALASAAVAMPAAAQEGAPFIERFQTLDETRWVVADGWSNGEATANDWRRSQIQHRPGGVEITLARTAGGERRFSSSELQSRDYYDGGYFEVRMRAPRGSGLVTGFFTYVRPGNESTWEEIDIEILGRDTRSIQFTYFHRGEHHVTTVPLPFDAAKGFHTYGFEWTPSAIRWYVDGRLLHEETGANGPLPRRPQRLYLHLWNSETLTSWLGPILPWEGPWRLAVSCVAHAQHYEGRALCAEEEG